MTLSESSIYIGLVKLRNKLYQAQFLMDKSSRIIYGTPLIEASGKTIAYFTLAYTVKEKRAEYLDEAIGWYLGAELNENKFYCQHYTKGCECLGIHIKRDRIYPNKRVVYRAIQKDINSNRCIRKAKIHKIISQINSYLGVCKNTNGYNQALKIIRKMSEKWFDYLNFNTKRVCLQPKYNYSERNLIIEKYNLK